MLVKEFIQLKRDRVSFAMIIMIPLVQLLLFGYAINTNPRNLPTAVLLQEQSDLGRSILARAREHAIFQASPIWSHDEAEFDRLLASGDGAVRDRDPARTSSARCAAATGRRMLVAADATDPVASGSALGALEQVVQTALAHDRAVPDSPAHAVRDPHARPLQSGRRRPQLNIVPGLVGTILTMTMLIFTALSVTREIERGTMESLLSMPITPVEIMLGKIMPYILVGFVQAALIIGIGIDAVRRAGARQPAAACAAEHAVHHHQSVDRLHLLDAWRRTSCRRCRCR